MRRCCEKIPINSRNRQRLRILVKIRRVVVRRLPVDRLHLSVKMYRELFDPNWMSFLFARDYFFFASLTFSSLILMQRLYSDESRSEYAPTDYLPFDLGPLLAGSEKHLD